MPVPNDEAAMSEEVEAVETMDSSTLDAAIPPDVEAQIQMNDGAVDDDESVVQDTAPVVNEKATEGPPVPEPSVSIPVQSLTPEFVPEDIVYSKSLNSVCQVKSVELQPAGGFIYSVQILGVNRINRGLAILPEDDMELRRSKAVKHLKKAAFPTVYASAAMLVKACEKGYDKEADSLAGALHASLEMFKHNKLFAAYRPAIESAQAALNNARLEWGGGGNPVGHITSAFEALGSIHKLMEQSSQKSDVWAGGGTTLPVETHDSMKEICKKLSDISGRLISDDAMTLENELKAVLQTLDTSIAPKISGRDNAKRSLSLMRALVNKARTALSHTATVHPNARYPVGGDNARNALFNTLAQASFMGDMMTRRMSIRTVTSLGRQHGIAPRHARKMYFITKGLGDNNDA